MNDLHTDNKALKAHFRLYRRFLTEMFTLEPDTDTRLRQLLLFSGLSDRCIARRLSIPLRTVCVYRARDEPAGVGREVIAQRFADAAKKS